MRVAEGVGGDAAHGAVDADADAGVVGFGGVFVVLDL